MTHSSKLPDLPSVTLSNGLVVANYSSPHPFLFTDGSILPACSDERATITKLNSNEKIASTIVLQRPSTSIVYSNVILNWELTWFLEQDGLKILKAWHAETLPWDVIIVPLPFMIAWNVYCEKVDKPFEINRGPFRVVRLADRLEPKRVHIDKFCVI